MKTRRMRTYGMGLWAGAILGVISGGNARGVSIDFDDLAEGTVVTTEYAGLGVTFSGATVYKFGTVLTAGTSLNEIDFPPFSPASVLADLDGGPINGIFSVPVDQISGRFTYVVPVTLTIFDALDNVVGTVTSAFGENFGTSPTLNPPNELLQLSYAGGISRFEILGDPSGGSFTLDNLEFSSATTVPETTGLWPLAALLGLVFWHAQIDRQAGNSNNLSRFA